HIRRALRVGKSLERGQADAAAFSDVLNYLSAGLFLLDAQGRIVHTNAAADGMLSDGGLLRAIGGRLVAGIGPVERALRGSAPLPRDDGMHIGRDGVVVPLRAGDGERYIARALPLAGAPRGAGRTDEAATAVFVRRVAMESLSSSDIIAETYR